MTLLSVGLLPVLKPSQRCTLSTAGAAPSWLRGPSINDITASELVLLLEAAGQQDGIIREAVSTGRLQAVCSGSDLPVIDLEAISAELAAECDGVDLLILEGMGR